MTIHRPGGTKQVLQDLPANRHFTIHEPKARVGPQRPPSLLQNLSSQRLLFMPFGTKKLISKTMKATTPSLQALATRPATAIGDLDGDGLEDFFFGGAGR